MARNAHKMADYTEVENKTEKKKTPKYMLQFLCMRLRDGEKER
jgi:hypothetical protein